MSSFLGKNNLSRGIRNNNPGNLVRTSETWLGKISHAKNTDSRFEQFVDVQHGIRAMLRDLVNDISKGSNTITKLIHQYAPPFENNTISYINAVSKGVGIGANDTIKVVNNALLLKLARAIIDHENGKDGKLITDNHIKGAINILGTFKTQSVKFDVKKTTIVSLLIPVLLFFLTVFTISL